MPGTKGRSGGARKKSGRPPGRQNAATKARKKVAEDLITELSGQPPDQPDDPELQVPADKKVGKTPLHVLVKVYSYFFDEALNADGTVKDKDALVTAGHWAKEAAPYMHPKLAAVDGTPEGMNKSHEEALKELE